MATFIPPTDLLHHFSDFDADIPWTEDQRLAYNFLRHYRPNPRGRNVYKLNDGTYVESEPSDMSTVAITYHGGHEHEVSADEVTSLTAAGYGSYIS